MRLWHGHLDTPRLPRRPIPGELARLRVGTWPIEPGQSVVLRWRSGNARGEADARWVANEGQNSYWEAELGPFAEGRVDVEIGGRGPGGEVEPVTAYFEVGPRLDLVLMWHLHQPLYRVRPGFYEAPWVRLHALRDYYGMAALLLEEPRVRVVVNLTSALLDQVEEYAAGEATDELLSLARVPAEALSAAQADRLAAIGFDASWHGQVFAHPRYGELFRRRAARERFEVQDLRDLQVWSTLAWFDVDFRRGPVRLVTGRLVDVSGLVSKDRGYDQDDLTTLFEAQEAVLCAVVPAWRALQDRGQVELTTSPGYHPILPLLIDTDAARIDRPGAALPPRFAWPEDAAAHLRLGVARHAGRFGRPPAGIWPSEGAVSEAVIPLLRDVGARWFATDQDVLARSGRWGYDARAPDLLCRAWRTDRDGPAVFFRDTGLSDAIGFRYGPLSSAEAAVDDLLDTLRAKARALGPDGSRALLVALDGENPWGAYEEDGRPFLRALYRRLAADPEIRTTTPSRWLEHAGSLPELHDLATGSWADEPGSAPGTDLGTWVGEPEENRAWELLGRLRAEMARANPPPRAWCALRAAEGSDWTWWYGADQDSGSDDLFDRLFRAHLANAWRALGSGVPAELEIPLTCTPWVWTFAAPIASIPPGSRLAVRTNCPGRLTWSLDEGPDAEAPLAPVGGVMAGQHRFEVVLGPFNHGQLSFVFHCGDCRCKGGEPCCADPGHVVRVEPAGLLR